MITAAVTAALLFTVQQRKKKDEEHTRKLLKTELKGGRRVRSLMKLSMYIGRKGKCWQSFLGKDQDSNQNCSSLLEDQRSPILVITLWPPCYSYLLEYMACRREWSYCQVHCNIRFPAVYEESVLAYAICHSIIYCQLSNGLLFQTPFCCIPRETYHILPSEVPK